jgi:Ricin-type beta-trefoil lectin domain-like
MPSPKIIFCHVYVFRNRFSHGVSGKEGISPFEDLFGAVRADWRQREGSMKVRKFQVVFTLAAAATFAVAVISVMSPQPVQAQKLQGRIANQLTHLCLQPANGSTVAGTLIVQEPCSSSAGAAQVWTVVAVKSPYYHYVNQLSGLCLETRGGAQNHTPVQQAQCADISNENWLYAPAVMGSKTPVILYSGDAGTYLRFCLDVPGGQATPGLALQIYACNGTGAQQWD